MRRRYFAAALLLAVGCGTLTRPLSEMERMGIAKSGDALWARLETWGMT